MATIRERFGKYHVQIRKKGQKPQTKSFSKLSDAEAWARKTESAIERGEWHDTAAAEHVTVADVLRRYRDGRAMELKDCPEHVRTAIRAAWEDGEEPKITTPTRERIDVLIRKNPLFEQIGILNFDQAEISDYINKRKMEGVSNATVDRELDLISTAINRAKGAGLPIKNAIEFVDRPKYKNARVRRLRTGEMRALLAAMVLRTPKEDRAQVEGGTRNPYMRWLLRWSVETTIRRSETLQLEWKDLDAENLIIRLPAHITKAGIEREVPLSTRALRVLRAMRILRIGDEPRIFPTSIYAVKKAWERACRRAGIVGLRFHDLRHEGATRLGEVFSNPLDLKAITGHQDLRSLDRYYHPDAKKLAKKLA